MCVCMYVCSCSKLTFRTFRVSVSAFRTRFNETYVSKLTFRVNKMAPPFEHVSRSMYNDCGGGGREKRREGEEEITRAFGAAFRLRFDCVSDAFRKLVWIDRASALGSCLASRWPKMIVDPQCGSQQARVANE